MSSSYASLLVSVCSIIYLSSISSSLFSICYFLLAFVPRSFFFSFFLTFSAFQNLLTQYPILQAIVSTRALHSVDSHFKSWLSNHVTQHNFQGFPQSHHSRTETVPQAGHEGFISHPLQFIIQSAFCCHSRLRILNGGLVSNPQTNKPSPGRYRQAVQTTPTLLLFIGGLCASQMEVG
jgi:hypothetical protein